jgi:hypothetical protein
VTPPRAGKVLAFAAMVGVAGDYLLRGGEWRLGFALWIAVICVCAAMLGPRLPGERRLLLAGTALAPFGLVWRDAPMVYSIDMLSLLCIGALTIWHGSGRRIGELSIVEAPGSCQRSTPRAGPRACCERADHRFRRNPRHRAVAAPS